MSVNEEPNDRANGLVGCWEMVNYALGTGVQYSLDGLMIVTPGHFAAVHFMIDGTGPQRASGEGGQYVADGKRITFRHRYFISLGEAIAGLPSEPDTMTLEQRGEEPYEECTYEIEDGTLRIAFPSGNVITFHHIEEA